ncbi:MAG: SUMF1/EgtB/PvdO family nonheme iron enzyme [Rhodomicrobium sp.]
MRVLAFIFCALSIVGWATAAPAGNRVALVVGNAKYAYAGTLANPVNDASDMAAALKGAGFTVVSGADLDKPALEKKIREFASALSGADTAVFFYAGHGLQVAGANYIVPVDAQLSTADALEFEMIKLDAVQRIMENSAKTNILFLDACRNNPLARNLARALGTRGDTIGKGLAPAESGIGTLISFSTQPGNVAQDGAGRNSPYTGPLARRIAAPGEDILSVLTAVRNEVLAATGNRQVPWENHALTARFYFNPAAPAQEKAQPPLSADAQAWSVVQNTASGAVLEEFIRRFPDSVYAGFAKARLEELKRGQTALNVPKPAPAQPAPGACDDGLLVSVTSGKKPCIKPGSGESFKDCPDCPEMAIAPSGGFRMGSLESEADRSKYEGPQHRVTIAKPFAVGKFAVTFAEWDACVDAGGCSHIPDDKGWGRGDRPVINVSWDDAKVYLAWLSKKTGKSYRLLTEAEREYVARAGTATPYWWGASIARDQANYSGGAGKTVPVKSFKPNPWGLYQVHGNVWEWVEDCWVDNYNGAPSDGSARTTEGCSSRVLRGGSWYDNPQFLRAAYRYIIFPQFRNYDIGFRVALGWQDLNR